jgi:hypothetical protein
MAAPDPILRFLALINPVPPEGAPVFGNHMRTARVVMLRPSDAAPAAAAEVPAASAEAGAA